MSASQFAPWTRRRVTQEIRALKRDGFRLSGTNMQAHSTLYGHARRLFGSLEAAVRASGINFDMERVQVLWTRTGILDWIRREWRKGRDIRPGVTKKMSAGVFNAAVREFGGWYPAIRAARIRGFKEVRIRKWTPKTLIAALRTYGPDVRCQDVEDNDPGLASTVCRTFGCWANARAAAGYSPTLPVRPRRWPREVILKTIRARAKDHPRLRTRVFFDLGGFAKAAMAMFGSWPNAVRAAGFIYIRGRSKGPWKWTREGILQTIQKRAADGKSLHQSDVSKEPGSLCSVARKEFGSWDLAIRAAGLEPPVPKRVWTMERVLELLRKHARNGVCATTTTLHRKYGGLHYAAKRFFGSWEAAILAAGLKAPARQWKWPKERILSELVRRKKQGRRISESLYSTAYHVFGGVKKALAIAKSSPAEQ